MHGRISPISRNSHSIMSVSTQNVLEGVIKEGRETATVIEYLAFQCTFAHGCVE